MSVIPFETVRPAEGDWRASELRQIAGTFAPALDDGHASGWAVASTECGDPQFYLLGPDDAEDCILSLSRVGGVYVLEDGAGRIVSESTNLSAMAEEAWRFLRQGRAGLVARLSLLWCGVRHMWEDKIEALLAESEEFVTVVAPQLAALA